MIEDMDNAFNEVANSVNPTEEVVEKVVLEAGEVRRFRMSNDGKGRPSYPPIVRCNAEGKEVCRYEAITIKGEVRSVFRQETVTKPCPMPMLCPKGGGEHTATVNRLWFETEGEVVCTLAKVKEDEDV